ncbi:MAG: hypothetical protein IJI53_06440 [Clostridia bacterium]|nr:hypothetical protein [Clostridia bacterium]MBR0407656.1 hypothetical protein [Clostridia bacterium]
MLDERMERFIDAAERLRLGEYVRFHTDRKARLRDAFLEGVARGLGFMIGFSMLGALAIYLLQALARQNLPLIGDYLAKVIMLVESRIH